MKTSNKLSQIAFIITREFRAISTSYAVLLVVDGGYFRVRTALQLYVCAQHRNQSPCRRSR